MAQVPPRDLGQSALSAFRADIPIGGRELTPADDETLAVATLLRHAAVAPRSAASRRMMREATRIAKRSLGKERLARPCDLDTPGFESPLDVFRKLGERCDENGQFQLENQLLTSLERHVGSASLTAGRIACRQARIATFLGEFDVAQMKSQAILVNQRWKRFDELKLRALMTLSGIAQSRGNFPEARRLVHRCVRVAGDRFPQWKGAGYGFLGLFHAKTSDFDVALRYYWKGYGLLKGDENRRLALLSDMSQTLLDAGRPAAARAGFARLLEIRQRIEARHAFPLIGGYAVACATLGDRAGVEWATSQILMLAKLRGHQRSAADALIECSDALAAVGQSSRAGTIRRRALRLAERYGFHDLTFKVEPIAIEALPSAPRLSQASEAIVERVMKMEPNVRPFALVRADYPDLGQSALSAFRADIPIGGRELTPADNETLVVATLLRHATVAPHSAASRRMLRHAARIAKQLLGKCRLREGCHLDPPGYESPLDVFRMVAEWLSDNGRAHLEEHVLVSLERHVGPDGLTAGRIRAQRAAAAQSRGEIDIARTQAEALCRGDRAAPRGELRLRGRLVLIAIACGRGNLPAARRMARCTIREAGRRFPKIAALAWSGLGIAAAEARDFDQALLSFWKAYDLTKGRRVDLERGVLGNICRVLLDMGHPLPARAGFARLLADAPDVRAAPIWLGGFAVASGALGDSAGVTWATGQVLRLAKSRTFPREQADGLLNCSAALAAVGQAARAGTLRRRSMRLSERHGYHDLIFEAQPTTMRSLPSTSPLTAAAREIAARVAQMEPETLPTDLVYAD